MLQVSRYDLDLLLSRWQTAATGASKADVMQGIELHAEDRRLQGRRFVVSWTRIVKRLAAQILGGHLFHCGDRHEGARLVVELDYLVLDLGETARRKHLLVIR